MPPGPFDPYQPYGSAQMPAPGASGRYPVDQVGWTSMQMPAVAQHHHFSLFHDGNAGHLWRGEVASLLGDAVFTTGTLIWLVNLTDSPFVLALALALLGIPWLLAGPLAAPLTRVAEPGRALAWIGRFRFLLALGFIPMHFQTIYPVVFALIFGLALCGRLREALRVAAYRTCLAPGEPEHITSDLYIGGAVVAVVGPLVAAFAFALFGERILLVSVIAAVCYLLASNSDGFLDALTENKRAYLFAQPEEDDLAALTENDDGNDERLDDPELRREMALPAWYQVAPSTFRQAVGDLRAGMALAGGTVASQVALLALSMLGLVGGGLGALEIFFIQDRLGLPGFYLGPLVAAEAAGLALGVLLGDAAGHHGRGRPAMIAGMIGTGVALAAMALLPLLLAVLVCALLLGFFNALAVAGARVGLFAGFAGFERRAIASAETWLCALSGVVGAGLFAVFYAGTGGLPAVLAHLPFPGWPVGMVLLGMGGGLVVSAGVFIGLLLRKPRAAASASSETDDDPGDFGNFGDSGGDYDGESAYMPAAGFDGESAYMPAANGWDDDGRDGGMGWDDGGYADDALSAYGPAQTGRYGSGTADRSNFGAPSRRGGLLSRGDDDNDDDDDLPPRRGGAPGRSSPGGSRFRR
ncbi:MAG TPA: hypothetical protein VFU69_07260 [Ktedonobacterales bacterium]|nr:hypothetical protein [Ktedonobacterales bacterium]